MSTVDEYRIYFGAEVIGLIMMEFLYWKSD